MASNNRNVVTGFANSATEAMLKNEEKELKTVQEVHDFIQNEILAIDNFERNVKNQINEIEDLEKNLKAVLIRFETIITLIKQRDKLVKLLIEEVNKPKVDMNVDACNNYFAMIQRIDQNLNPMGDYLSNALAKFMLPEFHQLYAQSDELRTKIKDISGRAGKIQAEFVYVWKNIINGQRDLDNISETVRTIEQERRSRQKTVVNPVGYR
ncbi:MAG: hypothetical protein ACP5N2_02875 [Candidatus Nanoarchaeia archaeon]